MHSKNMQDKKKKKQSHKGPPDLNLQNIDVDELLEKAYETDDDDEVIRLTDLVLSIEPDDPEALLLQADIIEDDAHRMELLKRALHGVDEFLKMAEELENAGVDFDDDDDEAYEDEDDENAPLLVRLAILERMAFTYFSLGDNEHALELATECRKHDDIIEDNRARQIYYRVLIETKQWQRILTETMKDDIHELGWAYARLVAAFMLTPKGQDHSTAARMFWEALLMSPNVPFYILGYCDEPSDDESDEEIADFGFACLYTDILSFSRELLNWFTLGTILFGIFSGRFEEQAMGFLLDIVASLGGDAEFQRIGGLLDAHRVDSDEALLELLAANRCLAKN